MRCIKKNFTRIHDRFLRDHVSRQRMLEHDRYEDVCREWTIFQNKISPIECQNQNIFTTDNWWISLNKSGDTGGPLRSRSDFNQALSTSNRLKRESGGQKLRSMPHWKYQQWFFLHLVAIESILVVFLRIQRKSMKKGCMQRFSIERSNPLSTDLWVKPQTNVFHEIILFCYRWMIYG